MNTTTVTSPQKGMILDLHNSNLKEGMYTYALNACMEQTTENGFVLQNESSNFLSIVFPKNFIVIGKVHVQEQSRIIFFLKGPNDQCQIGEVSYKNAHYDQRPLASVRKAFCKNCNTVDLVEPIPLEYTSQVAILDYRTIIDSTCLNFNKYFSIDAEYKITDCTLEVYFIDGYNNDRYIYFDYTDDFNLVIQPKFFTNDILDCEKLLIQPTITRPIIEVDDVFSGGNLTTGVYQFFSSYATANGFPLTPYYGVTQPIPIFAKAEADTTFVTDQAIRIKISNIKKDTVYQFYNIIVGETINQITEYKLIATLPIEQTLYTYAGNSTAPRKTLDELLQKYPYYHHANSITKSNEYLFRANLVENKRLNLQRAANYIKTDWQTIVLKEGDYRLPEIAQKYRSYMRDEVYPLAIVYEFEEGEDSPAFHIPGRTSDDFDRQPVFGEQRGDVLSEVDCNSIIRDAKWQVYNTSTITSLPHKAYNSCDEAIWESGPMGYWESTELYPTNSLIWGGLAGSPIRHHKFPDSFITHIHDNQPVIQNLPSGVSFDQVFDQKAYIYPIGFKIDHRSVLEGLSKAIEEGVLTEADVARIKSYRIVRGNRTNNKSVIAKGLLFDMWEYVKNSTTYFYPNYPYNDLRTDPFIARNNHYKGTTVPYLNEYSPTGRYTFHSPDTHFVEPTIGSILKLETLEYGKSKGYFTKAEDHVKYRLVSDQVYDTSVFFGAAIANFTVINSDVQNATSSLGSSIGGAVGTLAGGPLGATIGTVAGGLLGGLFANDIGGPLKDVAESMTKMALAIYNMEKLLTFFRFLIPPFNYNYQYNSRANYNSFQTVPNEGRKIRAITNYSYLPSEIVSITENNTAILVNNYNRESSVYIKIPSSFPKPNIQDVSRFIASDRLGCTTEVYDNKTNVVSDVSSYYASVKNPRLAQYGNIYEIDYLETNSISYSLTNDLYKDKTIFGGDIFINRFSLKRKMPFFTENSYGLPDGTDFYLSDFANVGYPTYYMNTQGDDDYYLNDPLSFFRPETTSNTGIFRIPFITKTNVTVPNLAGNLQLARKPKMNLDCNFVDPAKWIARKGMLYLYSYGIPSYLVESDINLDYRGAINSNEGDFYPRQQNLDFWLQEKNVRIKEDNNYTYNKTFSKQTKESFITVNNALFDPTKSCTTTYPNRVIYSEQSSVIDSSVTRDSWLIYKANNFYDFSKTSGALTSVEGIENDKVLVRFEKTSQVFNAYVTIPTDADNIQVSTGGMFKTKPQEYAHTDLGYAGSQHRDIIHTEFGHVFVDAIRGQIFVLNSSGLEELSKEGMKNWFSENLPFQMQKRVKNLPSTLLDNTYIGLGLSLYYDRVYKRLFITKLDYIPFRTDIEFDDKQGFYYLKDNVPVFVELTDVTQFKPIHWTVSYNFYTKGWISFHSFKPNYAISLVDSFLTGVNNNTSLEGASSIWAHNVSNRSYQVYYGKKTPFTIETYAKIDGRQHVFSSIEYNADAYHYNEGDTKTRISALPFNKMIVYTDRTNSGLLEGIVISPNDLYSSLTYPKVENQIKKVQVINRENNWRFNQFNDVVKANIPVWTQGIDKKTLNSNAINYSLNSLNNYPIRGEWCRVTLTNDQWTNYKILLKWLVNYSYQSIY